jgi:glutathionylspermidine synthase
MKRVAIKPRAGWEKKVEEIGLIYHHTEGRPYWNESAYYVFRSSEIDRIELATNELHQMCLKAAQHIIDNNRFKELAIPDAATKDLSTSRWPISRPSTKFIRCWEVG